MNRFFSHRFPVIFLIASAFVFYAQLAYAQQSRELILAGDAAFSQRGTNDKAAAEAIGLWERANANDPDNPEPLYKISMAYCFLGRFAGSHEKGVQLFQKGNSYAQKALDVKADSGPAHFWWAVSMAKSVEDKGKLVKLSVLGDVNAHLFKARAKDPTYYFGGADRVIAMVAIKSPVPSALLAKKHMAAAMKSAPKYSANLLFSAQAEMLDGNYDKAREQLEKTIALSPMPGFEKELADDQKQAKALLDQIKSK